MNISKPYKSIWRPLKGYSWMSLEWEEEESKPTLDYLADEKFASQEEVASLINTAHLIIRDLVV